MSVKNSPLNLHQIGVGQIPNNMRVISLLYCLAFAFVAFTALVSFFYSPHPHTSSPFSSLFSYFFPNSTAPDLIQPPHNHNHSHLNINGTTLVVAEPPTSLLTKQHHTGASGCQLISVEEEEEALMDCNLYDGSWVRDDSYPLYKPASCSFIDEQFNCIANGRPDTDYQKLRWKPHRCSLPRLNATRLLKMLKGKRLAFIGDSLNRNMWQSLVCILNNSVQDPNQVYEAHGRHRFRTPEASYSFIFKDYNLSVEFFVSPFLVRESEIPLVSGHKKETLRLDLMGESASKYNGADILIFNTGHWWTHEKTSKGEDYYQEGNRVYNKLHVKEAFRKAISTWARWVDSYVNPLKTMVFFRGYSESHFRGGRWNCGGQCHNETKPIENEKFLAKYPYKMRALETVLRGMNTPVSYLNITRITDYRKDGHPSIYRKQKYSEEENKAVLRYQDCSHWCLPGVPDTWNELLYAELLVKEYHRQKPNN